MLPGASNRTDGIAVAIQTVLKIWILECVGCQILINLLKHSFQKLSVGV